ncbi:hypothetical protein HL653_23755 [Sphingomonas sp. AP4-R1]|uniref:hypothetical protein n=1 Tax=Sphingomonas sp. AP4-R1 TaxID=2735134 RepID=UPI00149348EC|nr:hypothetical protein [Sphingomonas sp. AP4-R1]QJU60344.1 hypothetical protein HL653_23755 [Sphingomonas sp. AP4-R1]
MIATMLFAMLALETERTAPAVLPIIYGPAVTLHVGAKATEPWRISTASAVNATRFDWSIDMERRQPHAQIGGLTMAYERSRRRFSGNNLAGRPARSAAWQAAATYRLAGLDSHPLALEGKIGAERRMPTTLVDRGRAQQVRRNEINLAWYPTGGLSIGGGWQSQASSSRRSGIDRAISIASGNPLSEAGPHLHLGYDGSGGLVSQPSWRLGLDMGAYHLASRDIAALGAPNPLDERVSLSFRLSLR